MAASTTASAMVAVNALKIRRNEARSAVACAGHADREVGLALIWVSSDINRLYGVDSGFSVSSSGCAVLETRVASDNSVASESCVASDSSSVSDGCPGVEHCARPESLAALEGCGIPVSRVASEICATSVSRVASDR